MVHSPGPLLCRREAQPPEEKRGWVSELHSRPRFVRSARASSSPASGGEHRREAEGRHSRGRLFFGYFLLAKQKKVTRHQAKNTANHYKETHQYTRTFGLIDSTVKGFNLTGLVSI